MRALPTPFSSVSVHLLHGCIAAELPHIFSLNWVANLAVSTFFPVAFEVSLQ